MTLKELQETIAEIKLQTNIPASEIEVRVFSDSMVSSGIEEIELKGYTITIYGE